MKASEPPDERRAADIVGAVTGCATRRLDVGDGIQRPDYALVDPDGLNIGVLEVTSISSGAHNSFFSAKARKHRTWTEEGLRSNWIVTVDVATRELRRLRRAVSTVLVAFESAGISWAVSRTELYRGRVGAVPEQLAARGIVEVRSLSAAGPGGGFVTVNVMPTGGAVGISSAVAALEAVLLRDDNRRKLTGGSERRELFVWADPPSSAASALSTYSEEPWRPQVAGTRPAGLPEEVTAVWAALWTDDDSRLCRALWRGDAEGWQVLDPP